MYNIIDWQANPGTDNSERCKQVNEEMNRKVDDGIPVSLREVYNKLGINPPEWDDYYDRHGWTKDKGFHEFTMKERYPYGCPCCGRPWTEAS